MIMAMMMAMMTTEIMMKSKNILLALFLAFSLTATADSIPEMPKTYDAGKILDYVCYGMPENDSDYMSSILQRIDEKVESQDFRDRLKADLVTDIMKESISTDPEKYVNMVLQGVSADSLRQKVTNAYSECKKRYGHLWQGQPAPNIFFKDKAGKTLSLQDLRGKLLFIDIWGTWCAPCIEEIPYIKALYEKYKDNDKVLVMSIACDKQKDRQRWLNSLAKHKDMTWTQYQVTDESNKVLDNVYFVVGIPRFIIISPEGKIVDSDAPRPSFDNFDDYFAKIVEKYK